MYCYLKELGTGTPTSPEMKSAFWQNPKPAPPQRRVDLPLVHNSFAITVVARRFKARGNHHALDLARSVLLCCDEADRPGASCAP